MLRRFFVGYACHKYLLSFIGMCFKIFLVISSDECTLILLLWKDSIASLFCVEKSFLLKIVKILYFLKVS